jgi:ferredoxin
MEIQSAKLVSFSPTGTTKSVLRGIARGMNLSSAEFVDITKPEARAHPLDSSGDELLVVGVPVYMGRVPALLMDWLNDIRANGTPTVCVVVYGNRAFEDALLELRDTLSGRGCVPVAGAAFVGEHSFSSPNLPIAEGRPDAGDLLRAEEFGRSILEKLRTVPSLEGVPELGVPGNHPYGGITELWSVDFIEVSDECIQCGVCAEGCPVGAIDPEDSSVIDKEKCFTCCACIKNCPQEARTMKSGPVMDAAIRLNDLYSERQEPAFFL